LTFILLNLKILDKKISRFDNLSTVHVKYSNDSDSVFFRKQQMYQW